MVFVRPGYGGRDVLVQRKLVDDIPKVLNWWNFVYLADFELVIIDLEILLILTNIINKVNLETVL